MSVTITGLILIPLGLLLFARSRKELLFAAVFFAPFTATAVVNVDAVTLGVQPAYYFALLYIARFLVDVAIRGSRYRISRPRLSMLAAFWAFAVVAALSILAIPLYDPVLVRLPSNEFELLQLRTQNLTQYMYLLFMVVVMSLVALEHLDEKDLVSFVRTLLASAIFVCLWGWIEVGATLTGYPYPAFLFNNSVSFAQQYGSMFGAIGVPRISSVTPEPSMFARFMVAPTALVAYDYYNRHLFLTERKAAALMMFFIVTLLAALSTTGYVGIVIGGVCVHLAIQGESKKNWLHPVSIWRALRSSVAGTALLLGLLAVAVLAAIQILGVNVSGLTRLSEIVLTGKLKTGSGQERIGAFVRAFQLLLDHPFLGVGWGSNRTFDIVSNVFATTGFVGGGLFFYGHYRVAHRGAVLGRTVFKRRRWRTGVYLRALVLGLVVMMAMKALSEPDIVYVDQWLFLGFIIAGWARLRQQVIAQRREERASQPG